MPKLFNTDHQPQLINPVGDERAVLPGESYEFTDEQIAAGLTGSWSETDPREGLAAEKKFKQRRDRSAKNGAKEAASPAATTEPAESGDTKE